MSSTSAPVLVVGLGNPGPEYAATRHNVGWLVLDALAGGADFRKKFLGETARVSLVGRECVLLRPGTYMNESGRSVQPAAAFFRVAPGDVIVVHDELDLPFGDVRLKRGGGHAGHNGLRSVVQHLGTQDFIRVRLGIGRPPSDFRGDVASYVLAGFGAGEKAKVPEMVDKGARAVLAILSDGLERAMIAVNTRSGAGTGAGAGEGERGKKGRDG
jgi:peptidyl-tRNA hydrolase, PTH1 family